MNLQEILQLMAELPRAPVATDSEALLFIDEHALMGRGIGTIERWSELEAKARS